MNNDIINHPAHYTAGKYETIQGIERYDLGYHLGNAFKYISRAGLKSKDTKIQDLEKALWYIKRYEENAERGKEPFSMSEYLRELSMDTALGVVLWNIIEYSRDGSIAAAAELLTAYIDENRGGDEK